MDPNARARMLAEHARCSVDASELRFDPRDPTGRAAARRSATAMERGSGGAPVNATVGLPPREPPSDPPRVPRCPGTATSPRPSDAADLVADAPAHVTRRPRTTTIGLSSATTGRQNCCTGKQTATGLASIEPLRARATTELPTPTAPDLPVSAAEPDPDRPQPCLRAGALGLDPPRRPTSTSLGNGQIYDVRVANPRMLGPEGYVEPQVVLPSAGWHAPHVASYAPALGGRGMLWSIEVLDDDGNYNSRVTENLTLDQLVALVDRYKNGTDEVVARTWRPRSITAYSISEIFSGEGETAEYSFSTRFTVSWIGDNWVNDNTQNDVANWDIVVGLSREDLDIVIDAYVSVDPHWRPLSVCGYAYAYDSIFSEASGGLPDYEAVRYAAVMIKDSIDSSQWRLESELQRNELEAAITAELAVGRVPISISSWRSNTGLIPKVGYVVDGPDGPDGNNQRWSLLTVEDRSKDGTAPVGAESFGWGFVRAEELPEFVSTIKAGFRPVCIAPFTSYSDAPAISMEKDYANLASMQLLVVYRRHPPRYWRVKWDTTFEPADLVPRTLALQLDPEADTDDPYMFIDAYISGLMTSNLVNTMAWAVSVANQDVGAARAYTWAPEGFPTSYPNARFRSGSLAKDILATAIHKHWQDEGGYSLNGPFFPEYCEDVPQCLSLTYSGPQFATFDSILRHDGGWSNPSLATPDGYELVRKWMGSQYPVNRGSFLTYFLTLPDGSDGNTYWNSGIIAGVGNRRYSNFGYELMTDFLARRLVDGDVDRYQREVILQPLGAFDTEWGHASRWQHLPGEVIGTPDQTSAPSGGAADYLDDLVGSLTGATNPFSSSGTLNGSLVRPPVATGDSGTMDDDRWLEPADVTEGYGGWVALGSVVQGSGATVTTALDALRLVRSLRNWQQPGFPAWGMEADDGTEILSLATVNAMLNRTGAVAWGAGVLFQLRGWSAYSPNGALPAAGSPMFVFAGGNVGGGSSLVVRSVAGSCFAVLSSRNIGWVGQLDAPGTFFGAVLAPLGG